MYFSYKSFDMIAHVKDAKLPYVINIVFLFLHHQVMLININMYVSYP